MTATPTDRRPIELPAPDDTERELAAVAALLADLVAADRLPDASSLVAAGGVDSDATDLALAELRAL